MRPFSLLLLATVFALTHSAFAQSPPPKVVTLADVLKQVKAGASPADILTECNTVFTLTADEKAALVKAKAPAALIDALQVERMTIGDVTDFVVILDCSGSMKDEIAKGQTKMGAAKRVVGELFKSIPKGRNLAFIVYGHDAKLECKAVKVVRPLGPVDDDARKELAAALAGFEPTGHTPIANSLKAAGEVLAKSKGMSQIVVITDGVETCHGDPAAEAEALIQTVKRLRAVEVIAVGLKEDEKAAVAVIARRGRGKFYDADSAAELKKAVEEAVDVPLVEKPKPAKVDPKALGAIDLKLIEQLKDKDANVRKTAAETLAKRKVTAAAPALVERIADDVWVELAPGMLRLNNDPELHDGVSGLTGSKEAAVLALQSLAPNEVTGALVKALKSKHLRVREWATDRLGRIAGEDAEAGVATALKDDEAVVRLAAVGAVARRKTPAVDILAKALEDSDSRVRRLSADSLGALGAKAKDAVPALVNRVGDDAWEGLGSGLLVLNADDTAYDGVAKIRGSKDAALEALKKIAPDKVEDGLAKALDSKNPRVKEWAAKKLDK